MASFFNDDDSTDDEIAVNLQLAERLRINREHGRYAEDTSLEDTKELKQICNMHRKKFAQTRNSSSSSSVEVSSDNPSGTSYDSYHNKKRQNGDKNVEQFGNPKRTCLSDRLRSSPEWRVSKIKAGHKSNSKQAKCPDFIQMESGSPMIRSCARRKNGDFVNGSANTEDSDFESPRITRSSKKVNGVKSSKNKPSGPSQNLESRPSTSFCLGNSFFESGGDDDSKLCRRNGALRGGKPECANGPRLDRKFSCVLADSEESEEDTCKNVYRCKPLVFSSSDSEGDFCPGKAGKAPAVTHSVHPPYENGFDRACRFMTRQPRNSRNSSRSNKKAFNLVSSSNADQPDSFEPQCFTSSFPSQSASEQSCRAHRSPRMNLAAKVAPACLSNQNSAPVRGRRGGASSRTSRRTVSPQLRNHRSQNQHRDSCGRAVSARSCNDSASLVAAYPDLFNAEESDNEFFTANSYSDTETSTESPGGGVTINASFPTQRGGTISCSIEHDGDTGTDDEIIVLYSAGPNGRNLTRRGGSRNSGRRFPRGSTPHRQLHNVQEVGSQSPDPVEQVRQLEEDERMARMLQAEFDAEVDPDFNPPLELESDVNDSDSDDVIDPVGDSDSDDYINQVPAGSSARHPHFIVNRFTPRGANTISFGLGLGAVSNNRRFGGGRRAFQLASRENNFDALARWFGLEVPPMSFPEVADYETLLSLDDDTALNRGLHKSDINRLPTRRFMNPSSASSAAGSSTYNHKRTELNKECQVCLMDYENGDILRILPCFHEFHTPCIDPWLKINHTCPVCRVRVDLST